MPQRAEPADSPRGSRFCVPFNNHAQRDAIRGIMQLIEDGLALSPLWYYDASERGFVRMQRGAHFSRFEIKVANENKPYPNAKGPALKHVLIFTLLGSKGEVGNDEVEKTRTYLDQSLAANEALHGVYRGGVRQIRVLPYNASVDDYFWCHTKPLDMGKEWVQQGYPPALEWKGLELFQAIRVTLRNVETPEWAAAAREMAPAELWSVGNAIPRYATTIQARNEGWCVGEHGPYPKPEALAKQAALLAADAEAKAQAYAVGLFRTKKKFALQFYTPQLDRPLSEQEQRMMATAKAQKLKELKATPRPPQPPERPTAAERTAQLNAEKRAAKAERVERKTQKEAEVKWANSEEQLARKRHKRQLSRAKKAERKADAAQRKAEQRNDVADAPRSSARAKAAAAEATREAEEAVKEAARERSKAKRFKKEATKCLERLQMLKSLSAAAVQALVAKELAAKEAEAAARMARA